MGLEVIGAGVGRTGTNSLKLALEQLLGAPCYHMFELLRHPEHLDIWERALETGTVDWDRVFARYRAAVDWVSAAFLPELAARYPDAIVLLSMRDADEWWRSADSTVFKVLREVVSSTDDPWNRAMARFREFTVRMLDSRFTPEWRDERAAREAYARHNATVRELIPPDRLVEWRPGDGWAPICAALGRPVPDQPFPYSNTSSEFRAVAGLAPAPYTAGPQRGRPA